MSRNNVFNYQLKNKSFVVQEFNNLQRQKIIFLALMLLFVIIIIWIIVSVFATQQTTTLSPEQKLMAQPFSPNLNEQILLDLQDKKVFSIEELRSFPIYRLVKNKDNQLVLINILADSDDETSLLTDQLFATSSAFEDSLGTQDQVSSSATTNTTATTTTDNATITVLQQQEASQSGSLFSNLVPAVDADSSLP